MATKSTAFCVLVASSSDLAEERRAATEGELNQNCLEHDRGCQFLLTKKRG